MQSATNLTTTVQQPNGGQAGAGVLPGGVLGGAQPGGGGATPAGLPATDGVGGGAGGVPGACHVCMGRIWYTVI